MIGLGIDASSGALSEVAAGTRIHADPHVADPGLRRGTGARGCIAQERLKGTGQDGADRIGRSGDREARPGAGIVRT